MSNGNEAIWAPVMERMKRRLQAGGKVIALGAFMSAKREALPIFSELNFLPEKGTFSQAEVESAHALCTKERCGSAIRAGLAKKFITALLSEVPLAPVTDEEVAEGIKKGEADHESKVAARRAARADEKHADPSRSAVAGGNPPGPDDVDEEGEEEDGEEVGEEEDEDDGEQLDGDEDTDPGIPSHAHARRSPPRLSAFEKVNRGAERAAARTQRHHSEDAMSNENDDQYEGQHDEDEVDEQEEQPPSKRPRARQPPPQVIVVPQAPRQKAPRNLNAAPRNRFIKNSDMVRISKRIAGGKRSHIGDYTSEDIGPGISLQQFIKEYIDEENREPGRTVYEVVPLNGNGDEIGRPQQYIIENQSFAETNPNDPVGQARSVLDLFADLKEQENEKQSQNSEMLKEAQKKAIAGGDMQGLFMFMMMNQMMDRPRGGIDEAAIIAKVLDRLGPQQQPMMMPPPLPPVQMVPPAPAPLAGAMEQLVQASIASMLKPDAPPPSPIQQLKDMMELQTLMQKMSGSGTDMATVVKLLLEKQTPVKPPEVAGVDNMMLTFEKLTTMVKALAPQINQGGWAGPIQGIFSQPEVQKAIANILGGVTGQPGAVAPQLPPGAPGAQTVNGQAANANGQVQPQPQQPQPQPTPQMRDAANAFRIAQTKEVRVERLMQLIQVMYLAGYQPVIEPVLTAARDGNIVPAQRFLATLIADIDPSKVTVDLINAVLRVSAGLAGEEGKKMMAALDASEKGETLKVEEKKPGTVETPNAQVVPIAAAPAHANHAAYMAQVAELERQKEGKKDGGMATQPSVPPAANPHAPEVEVKEKKVVEAKVEVATEAQTPKVEAQTPSQTPPAEVINFNEKPEKPAEQTAR